MAALMTNTCTHVSDRVGYGPKAWSNHAKRGEHLAEIHSPCHLGSSLVNPVPTLHP